MGTSGRDRLAGGPQADAMFGFGGTTISGGAGGDLIDEGNRQDVIDAGPGDDRIRAYDGWLDTVRCAGDDVAFVDPVDMAAGCEELREYSDDSAPRSPRRPPAGSVSQPSASFPCSRENRPRRASVRLPRTGRSRCRQGDDAYHRGRRDSALTLVASAASRWDTWTADGIKVQNHGGRPRPRDRVRLRQVSRRLWRGPLDGIQAMGGYRLTFRNLAVDCSGTRISSRTAAEPESRRPPTSCASGAFWARALRRRSVFGHVHSLGDTRHDGLHRPLSRDPHRPEDRGHGGREHHRASA